MTTPSANCTVASSRAANPELPGSTADIYDASPARTSYFRTRPKLPGSWEEFGAWLKNAPPAPAAAFDAHYRLTAIHPFADGNGRTARLLMNLVLLRGGYPPVAIRPEDRKSYLDSLERASLAGGLDPYRIYMSNRLDATLADYLSALHEALP